MRINTDGNYAWREDLYDDVADLLDEKTRVGGLDAAAELVLELLGKPGSSAPGALQEALDHPDMTPELAEVLTTDHVRLEFEISERREVVAGD